MLGVLAVFDRKPFAKEDVAQLRTFADHAAVALLNARAFEELESLRSRLERENASLREQAGLELVPLSRLKQREKETIALALERAGGKVSGPGGAAELLGAKPPTPEARQGGLGLRARGAKRRRAQR